MAKSKKVKEPAATVIQLTRKEILTMAELVNHFPDVGVFDLYVDHSSGIGQATNLKFTLDLAGEKKDVTVDTTDIGSW